MPTGVRRPILALVSYFEQFYCLSSRLEHIILSHMAKHLFLNNILIDQQHGFREKFSCETQHISAIHDWAKGIKSASTIGPGRGGTSYLPISMKLGQFLVFHPKLLQYKFKEIVSKLTTPLFLFLTKMNKTYLKNALKYRILLL